MLLALVGQLTSIVDAEADGYVQNCVGSFFAICLSLGLGVCRSYGMAGGF